MYNFPLLEVSIQIRALLLIRYRIAQLDKLMDMIGIYNAYWILTDYSKLNPGLFSRYLPNILPPTDPTLIEQYAQEDRRLQEQIASMHRRYVMNIGNSYLMNPCSQMMETGSYNENINDKHLSTLDHTDHLESLIPLFVEWSEVIYFFYYAHKLNLQSNYTSLEWCVWLSQFY